jgi:hypothetical protein
MMMDMTGMSVAMWFGMGVIWLLVIAFLVLGIAAFIRANFGGFESGDSQVSIGGRVWRH